METNPTTTAAVPRTRRSRPHPARRARLAVGSASAAGMLALTGWMAVTAHANASPVAAVTTTEAAAASSVTTSDRAISSTSTQSSYSSAQAATPSSQVTTSSHGS